MLPFLILAFTVNSMRDNVRASQRKLNYVIMDIRNPAEKIWITTKWWTYPAWHPIYWFFRIPAQFVTEMLENVLVGITDGFSELTSLLPSLKPERGTTQDPESLVTGVATRSAESRKADSRNGT